eukprot:6482980-Amphidinium_carterae.1
MRASWDFTGVASGPTVRTLTHQASRHLVPFLGMSWYSRGGGGWRTEDGGWRRRRSFDTRVSRIANSTKAAHTQ